MQSVSIKGLDSVSFVSTVQKMNEVRPSVVSHCWAPRTSILLNWFTNAVMFKVGFSGLT